jgi:bifunctional non-homologous end joining protein LigD
LESIKKSVEKEIKFRKEDILTVPTEEELKELKELEKSSSYNLSIRASDPLKRYKSKRDFDKTNEPEGNVESKNKHRFVIQKHDATNLHFDLRLENDDGVLQSWALPKHKMPEGKEKLLAVETEPHPVEYAKFKGDIEEGYGEGHVDIWASGKYEPIEVKKDKIQFKINSGKAEGTFVLFRTDGKKWMLMRKKED